jgi:hypothetical protein
VLLSFVLKVIYGTVISGTNCLLSFSVFESSVSRDTVMSQCARRAAQCTVGKTQSYQLGRG